MTLLSDNNRFELWKECMRDISNASEGCTITKAELRDAINAVDQWVEDNSSGFNSAIPQPARGALNSKQKSRLLMLVLRRRYEVT